MEVPDGWVQLIGGPGPKSEKWPLQSRQKPGPDWRATKGPDMQQIKFGGVPIWPESELRSVSDVEGLVVGAPW